MEVRPDRQNATQFLPSSGRIDTAIWMHYFDARRQLHKNAASNIEQVMAETPHKASTIRPPASPIRKIVLPTETTLVEKLIYKINK